MENPSVTLLNFYTILLTLLANRKIIIHSGKDSNVALKKPSTKLPSSLNPILNLPPVSKLYFLYHTTRDTKILLKVGSNVPRYCLIWENRA